MMNKFDILEALTSLAGAQGTYQRYLDYLLDEDLLDEVLEYLESQNFRDVLDLVLFFEE